MLKHIRTRAYLKAKDRLLHLEWFIQAREKNYTIGSRITEWVNSLDRWGTTLRGAMIKVLLGLTIPDGGFWIAVVELAIRFYVKHARRSAEASLEFITSPTVHRVIQDLRTAVEAVRALRRCEPGCAPAAEAYEELDAAFRAASSYDDRLRVRFNVWP